MLHLEPPDINTFFPASRVLSSTVTCPCRLALFAGKPGMGSTEPSMGMIIPCQLPWLQSMLLSGLLPPHQQSQLDWTAILHATDTPAEHFDMRPN